MLSKVNIKNFKSIRDLEFSAKRVNVFIGEPNTGKSNIIEALALFSGGTFRDPDTTREILRFNSTSDLFFDQKIAEGLSVQVDNWTLSLAFKGENYQGAFLWQHDPGTQVPKGAFTMNHSRVTASAGFPQLPVRHYAFRPLTVFPNRQPGLLSPPFGENLFAVLYTNESLKKTVVDLIRAKGFRLQFKPTENELLIAKDVRDELYSYPWTSVSETLRRFIFLTAMLDTNRDATLLLDEPEANTFPFYTMHFAERVGLDESNQYFIVTHNPYLLSSVVEKSPKKDLNVFVATMDNFETKLNRIPDENLGELLELNSDAFFNLDRLVKHEAVS